MLTDKQIDLLEKILDVNVQEAPPIIMRRYITQSTPFCGTAGCLVGNYYLKEHDLLGTKTDISTADVLDDQTDVFVIEQFRHHDLSDYVFCYHQDKYPHFGRADAASLPGSQALKRLDKVVNYLRHRQRLYKLYEWANQQPRNRRKQEIENISQMATSSQH